MPDTLIQVTADSTKQLSDFMSYLVRRSHNAIITGTSCDITFNGQITKPDLEALLDKAAGRASQVKVFILSGHKKKLMAEYLGNSYWIDNDTTD